MGFNRRKMEDERRRVAEEEAAARRATDAQVLEDAERLNAAWNERRRVYETSGHVFDSTSITAATEGNAEGLWTCAVAVAVFRFDSVPST